MKKLHLIRHAKSSWDHPGLGDKERPLNKRGLKATEIMAPAILEAGCSFDAVFTSPAIRARTTIENIAAHLPDEYITPQIDDALYTFGSANLLNFCRTLGDDMADVVIVGHNPAITDLTNRLSGSVILNVPTCAYVQMEFDGPWAELDTGTARLIKFLTPKMVAHK